MIPPMPKSDEPQNDRLNRFAKAVLADPKSEVATWEELIAHLKAERREIENRLAEMKKTLAKPKQSIPTVH
jgi:hypothetical protein